MTHEEVYKNGEDNGWLLKQNYWFDPDHAHGFEIADLDVLYPDQYFAADHVKPETVNAYCSYVMQYFKSITGKDLESVVEVGCAGGWFGKGFKERGVYVTGTDGATSGLIRAAHIGTGVYPMLVQHDLRQPLVYPLQFSHFEMALCTEVAEHIEPPFSATLVRSLTQLSDLVWFSFEPPNTNPAHRHHPNEMPAKFWINLFEFFGYGCYMLPDEVFNACEGRGRMIFYNKSAYEGNQFLQQ